MPYISELVFNDFHLHNASSKTLSGQCFLAENSDGEAPLPVDFQQSPSRILQARGFLIDLNEP